ncbi:MAG: Uma2 family endonuclease [Cyanobacteria bacterium J06638_20]
MTTLVKWSVDDYHRMIEAGILRDRPVELLAGDVVEMSPETPFHYALAKQGAKYLEALLGDRAEVRFNGPITLSDSEPEPDVAIVQLPASKYFDRHPTPDDIYWIVEVSKTSLKKDLELKSNIYATAAISEYWVVNLQTQELVILRQPQAGRYTQKQTLTDGTITPLAFEDVSVMVNRLLVAAAD